MPLKVAIHTLEPWSMPLRDAPDGVYRTVDYYFPEIVIKSGTRIVLIGDGRIGSVCNLTAQNELSNGYGGIPVVPHSGSITFSNGDES